MQLSTKGLFYYRQNDWPVSILVKSQIVNQIVKVVFSLHCYTGSKGWSWNSEKGGQK